MLIGIATIRKRIRSERIISGALGVRNAADQRRRSIERTPHRTRVGESEMLRDIEHRPALVEEAEGLLDGVQLDLVDGV